MLVGLLKLLDKGWWVMGAWGCERGCWWRRKTIPVSGTGRLPDVLLFLALAAGLMKDPEWCARVAVFVSSGFMLLSLLPALRNIGTCKGRDQF